MLAIWKALQSASTAVKSISCQCCWMLNHNWRSGNKVLHFIQQLFQDKAQSDNLICTSPVLLEASLMVTEMRLNSIFKAIQQNSAEGYTNDGLAPKHKQKMSSLSDHNEKVPTRRRIKTKHFRKHLWIQIVKNTDGGKLRRNRQERFVVLYYDAQFCKVVLHGCFAGNNAAMSWSGFLSHSLANGFNINGPWSQQCATGLKVTGPLSSLVIWWYLIRT